MISFVIIRLAHVIARDSDLGGELVLRTSRNTGIIGYESSLRELDLLRVEPAKSSTRSTSSLSRLDLGKVEPARYIGT